MAAILERLKNEPVVVAGLIASALVALAAQAHVVLDPAATAAALVPLVTGAVTRRYVRPARLIPDVLHAAAEIADEVVTPAAPAAPAAPEAPTK